MRVAFRGKIYFLHKEGSETFVSSEEGFTREELETFLSFLKSRGAISEYEIVSEDKAQEVEAQETIQPSDEDRKLEEQAEAQVKISAETQTKTQTESQDLTTQNTQGEEGSKGKQVNTEEKDTTTKEKPSRRRKR
jgi:hypothetical protein